MKWLKSNVRPMYCVIQNYHLSDHSPSHCALLTVKFVTMEMAVIAMKLQAPRTFFLYFAMSHMQ